VLLRTAIVATAASFSFWGTVGTFAYSVVIAIVVGGIVAMANLAIRRRVKNPTVNTVISFVVPFVASVPAELLHSSGLVAAVVAGLVTGIRAPRELSPQNRLSDAQNWRTVELVLEGVVFLTMGLQLKSILTEVQEEHSGIGIAVLVAAGALVLTVLVRAAYVAPLLAWLGVATRRNERIQPRLQDMQEKLATPEGKQETFERMTERGGPRRTARDLERFAVRVTRAAADIEYFRREPMGWREGVVVVWAGMRGAVTVAAAQTLTIGATPQRAELVLIAYVVAILSLLLQGGTIGWLVRRLVPARDTAAVAAQNDAELDRIFALLRAASDGIPEPPKPEGEHPTQEQFEQARDYRLAVIGAQRTALLDARDDGTFDADVLEAALANLDASQIALELRGTLRG
jgi:CPA1 family monovalent cation:H+ antiporter